jgi:acyl-CoA synthetase (AMP-forming)/AMP-acid ligase II
MCRLHCRPECPSRRSRNRCVACCAVLDAAGARWLPLRLCEHLDPSFKYEESHRLDDEVKLKSCGSPHPLIEIQVADADGNELPDGQVGEFLIRSPSLTTGYFKQPEVTAAAFRNGWYHSGDAGCRDAEGFLYIVDRVTGYPGGALISFKARARASAADRLRTPSFT